MTGQVAFDGATAGLRPSRPWLQESPPVAADSAQRQAGLNRLRNFSIAVQCVSAPVAWSATRPYLVVLASAIACCMATFIFSMIGAMRDCMIDMDFCITTGIFSTNATPAGLW
jgi:hypothetical protein